MSQTVSPTPTSELDRTTVGNYFVSNYPPFAYWQREQAGDAVAALAQAPTLGNPLGLYVHIPFCRKRCHFCYFKVYTGRNSKDIGIYLEALEREIALLAATPAIGGRKLNFVYFGGGTPSYLSTAQLQQVAAFIQARLPWDEVEEVTFECEPGTLNPHKLKVIRELGVTRLSLGVENFDDHVLEINGRAHRSAEIGKAYGTARELGFPQINIDLIAGMVEETEDNWRDTVAKAIALEPDSITIYQMEIPYNTTIYKEMKAAGKLVAPVADWSVKRGWVAYAFAQLEAAGYGIASAYTAVRRPGATRFVYRDRLWRGADLLGTGVASFGHINGVHYQNDPDWEPYLERLSRGELPIGRALTPTADERLIREFILQFKLGRVGLAYFREKFGVDPLQRFAEPLATLAGWGVLEQRDDALYLTRDGLLRVDRLLHEFFLPQHRGNRYA